MSKLSDKLKLQREAKLERKKERERLKKEREKARKKAALEKKREKHRRKKIRQNNKKFYKKRRAKELKCRKEMGDVFGVYRVIIVKNRKLVKSKGFFRWKSSAFKRYNESIEQNQNEVSFPVRVCEAKPKGKTSERSVNIEYEILVLEKVKDGEDNITHFRNKDGKIVEFYIKNDSSWRIIAKHEWLLEETFNVYGYHPYRDRKTFDFILNEIVLKDVNSTDVKRIFYHNHRVVVQVDDDFDFITCKTTREAEHLHNALMDKTKDYPNIVYTGKLSRALSTWFLNELEKKTGWTREACKKVHTL